MKRKKMHAIAALAAVSLAATLTACSDSGSSSDATSESGDEAVTVAVSYGGLKFPYHSALKRGLIAMADELGNVELIEGDSDGDTGVELTNVQNMLQQQPDCLLIIPVSNSSSAPAEEAEAAGIPVVSFDQIAAGPTDAFVGYDQLQSGELLGQFVVDQYEAIGKPKIKVIYLRGLIGQAADTSRNEGVKATLEAAGLGADQVEIVEQAADYDRAKAQEITTTLLRQHSDADVIIANNDDMILGAHAGAQALGIATGPDSDLHLAGIDGVPEALTLIADGELDATMFQDPVEEANVGLPTCVAAANGEPVEDTVLAFRQVTIDDADAALESVQSVYE
ncbi:MAG: sugar ABC transporter substrate-binding protein [Beutenbergiaceae bacterium]